MKHQLRKIEYQEILYSIFIVGGTLTISLLSPKLATTLLNLNNHENIEDKQIKVMIRYLKSRGLLVRKRTGQSLILSLTSKGDQLARLLEATSKPIQPCKKWNNKWHMLSFDIPEKQKYIRNQLSIILKNIGCIQFHKSLYIAPYNFRDKISVIAQYYRIEGSIYYWESFDQPIFDDFKLFYFK